MCVSTSDRGGGRGGGDRGMGEEGESIGVCHAARAMH